VDRVEVTHLPGVGVLRTFLTAADDWIGVLELPSGRRQLFIDDPSDPDTRRLAAELEPDDSRILTELLGAHDDAGPGDGAAEAIVDWVQIPPGGPAEGRTVGELRLRSATGATVVAVLRDHLRRDVDPGFELRAGDIVVLTGGQDALLAATAALRG
jgi:TrkA domain protein